MRASTFPKLYFELYQILYFKFNLVLKLQNALVQNVHINLVDLNNRDISVMYVVILIPTTYSELDIVFLYLQHFPSFLFLLLMFSTLPGKELGMWLDS